MKRAVAYDGCPSRSPRPAETGRQIPSSRRGDHRQRPEIVGPAHDVVGARPVSAWLRRASYCGHSVVLAQLHFRSVAPQTQ